MNHHSAHHAHPSEDWRIVIVGAGFTGSMLAARLLRHPCAERLHITLIEREGVFGPGLAFGRARATNLLNVPAGNMSALDDDPGHFLRWAQERNPTVKTGDFLPRQDYGRYLRQTLDEAESASRAVLVRVTGRVTGAELDLRQRMNVRLADGRAFECDRVALCMGNFAPAALPGTDAAAEEQGFVARDPWSAGALDGIDPHADVLLVGTGLTMVDAVTDLVSRGHQGTIHALSRRGLLPASHRGPSKPPAHRDPPVSLESWDGRARTLLRIMRDAVDEGARAEVDWREIVTSIRSITPDLWRRMNASEQAKFLRHVRAYWEVARHRLAPSVAQKVREQIKLGRLVVQAGRVRTIGVRDGAAEVVFSPRAGTGSKTLRVARVINCTGPDCDVGRVEDALVRSLAVRGLIRPDALSLGIDCTTSGAAIDSDGVPSRELYVAGPLRKGLLWETTAAPELRKQVTALAEVLAEPARIRVAGGRAAQNA